MKVASGNGRLELVASAALFRGLRPPELEDVLAAAHSRTLAAGDFFFRQGDPADVYYVLSAGRARVTQLTPEGHQVMLHLVSPGEAFGVVSAIGQGEYPASAEAVESSEAFAWDGAAMRSLMERYARLAVNALHLVAGRLHEMQNRYRELATERVERRVARAVLRLARQAGRKTPDGILIDIPLSRQDLAEMTGTTLYTVSRILSGWQEAGLVEAGRERVLIRAPHRLVTIAEDLPDPREP